jgi:hypothetical protein
MSDEMSEINKIRARIAKMAELKKKLITAEPGWVKRHLKQQAEIEAFFYDDILELLATFENATYQLEKLEPLLDIPARGCVRNDFNRLLRTVKGEYW